MKTSGRSYVRQNANEPRATFKVREVNPHLTAMGRNTGGTSPLHRHNNVADSKNQQAIWKNQNGHTPLVGL